MYRYEGSTCHLKKTPFNRPGSKYLLSVFVNDVSMFGVLLFPRPKIEPFSALLFLVFGCFVKTVCNAGETTESTFIDIEQTGPRCRHLFYDIFSAGEMIP